MQVAVCVVAAVVFAAGGLDPYASMTTSMFSVGTLGIVVLQALSELSAVALRRKGTRLGWSPVRTSKSPTTSQTVTVRPAKPASGTTASRQALRLRAVAPERCRALATAHLAPAEDLTDTAAAPARPSATVSEPT